MCIRFTVFIYSYHNLGTTYVYGIQIPFKCTNDLMIVKVGYSENPGNPLGDIRSALNSLTDEGEFRFMSNYVNLKQTTAKEIIEKAKKERGHLLFLLQIQVPQSRKPGKYGGAVKKAIQDVVASFPLSPDSEFLSEFLAEFKSKLNEIQRKSLELTCGLNDWVMASATKMNALQQAFRDGKLDGNVGKPPPIIPPHPPLFLGPRKPSPPPPSPPSPPRPSPEHYPPTRIWDSKEALEDAVKSYTVKSSIQPAAETSFEVSFKIKGMKDAFTREYPIPT